ncbi:hypothetical protein GCM10027417_16400 [Glutamicibacter endophyticus]
MGGIVVCAARGNGIVGEFPDDVHQILVVLVQFKVQHDGYLLVFPGLRPPSEVFSGTDFGRWWCLERKIHEWVSSDSVHRVWLISINYLACGRVSDTSGAHHSCP